MTRTGCTNSGGAWGPGISGAEAEPFVLGPATQARVQDLLRAPGSIFTGERAAIQAELGGRTPEQALAALRVEDLRYRDLLYAVVTRVLPPHLLGYLPRLQDTFAAIDHYIHGLPEAGPRDPLPVRSVPDNGRLRPVVHRLVLRQSGGGSVAAVHTPICIAAPRQVYRTPLSTPTIAMPIDFSRIAQTDRRLAGTPARTPALTLLGPWLVAPVQLDIDRKPRLADVCLRRARVSGGWRRRSGLEPYGSTGEAVAAPFGVRPQPRISRRRRRWCAG